MQLVDADAPAVVRYWPAAHDEHVTVPVATAFCPVAQPMQHVEPDAPVVVRYWPEAHDEHAVKPVVAVYLPAAQSGQAARHATYRK